MRRCVVSLGVGGKFGAGLARQAAGLAANGFTGDVHHFTKYPDGCPEHEEVPYGFKPWLIAWAAKGGYEQVLWLDAACVPVKPLGSLFWHLAADGHALQYSPLNIGEWCSDACAEKMGMSRPAVMGLGRSIWACAIGLDFTHQRSRTFLDAWLAHMQDGISFHGDWKNESGQVSVDPRVQGHRHDQTVATILAYRLGMVFVPDLVCYDAGNIMSLEGRADLFNLPGFPAYILSNHNVKGHPQGGGA